MTHILQESDSASRQFNNEVIRTSSFKEQIENSGSRAFNDDIFDKPPAAISSPRRRGNQTGRSISPIKFPSDRSLSESPRPRRERSYLRSVSPDKMFRQPSIWAQWEQSKQKADGYLQEYNVKQMTGLYGKELRGKAEIAQEWYRANGMDRSKTQTDALDWLYSEIRTREQLKEEKNLNKLSHRHRVQKTPNVEKIRQREQKFTNDAIVTERKRTRFKDIIPQYDASEDRHCKAYFKRKDVQQLINVTRSRETTPAGSVTPGQTPRPTPGATPF